MKNNNIKSVLFDFDGVLSNGRFYSTISPKKSDIKEKIISKIFSKEAWPLIQTWMIGDKSYRDIHSIVSEQIQVDEDFLNKSLIDSVKKMKMNSNLFKFAKELRTNGVTVSIFTDNMDVFDNIFVPLNELNYHFDNIFSSSKYQMLKSHNDGKFLRYVLDKLSIEPEQTLFIDDKPKNGEFMKDFGGNFYQYIDYDNGYKDFRKWFNTQFTING